MKFKKDAFRKIRQQQRWTARSLAKKLGITSATLHMWESGHHDPPIDKISAIAELLNIAPDEILEHESLILESIETKKENSSVSNLLKTISSYEKSKLEDSIISITKNLKYLSDKIKELSMIFNAIMRANPAFCYIKDTSQNYVMASHIFLDTLGMPDDFDIRGKRDSDFYPSSEALENYREDEVVMTSGIAVKYKEKSIPGTRKAKQAIVFKIPIIGINSKPIGLMGTFLDITERKKAEDMVEILKKAMETMDEVIWIGRDAEEREDGSTNIKEILYAVNSNFRKKLLKNVEHLNYREQVDYFYSNMVVEKNRQKHKYKELMKENKTEIFYHIKHPTEDKVISISDKIYFIPKMNIFIGIVTQNRNSSV
ncbi:MAG: helix-turn-helix domain-containing protein [Lentisphaerota bacterium]